MSKRRSPKLARVIAVIGAGIVLATFVVKDVVSDQLKEANDSLDGAESLYLSQTYSSFTQDDLAYIKQQVDVALATIENGKESLETHEQILKATSQAGHDHLSVVTEYVTNLLNLTAKLPTEAAKAGQARDLQARCVALLQKEISLQSRLPGLFMAINENPKNQKALADLSEFERETEPLPARLQSVTVEAGNLTKAVIADLSTAQTNIERRYEYTKNLSYVLFLLGWICGLAGQLLDGEMQT